MSDSHLTEFSIEIPNRAHWALKSLNELCDVISRGTAPIYVEQSDVLAIGQRCVASSGFMSGHARPHSSRAMKNVLRPEIGDVLLNSTGAGTIGRSAVFDEAGIFIVDGHVTAIRSRKEAASPHWINAVLKTFWAQRHLERFCYSGSTNQLELNQTQLRNTRLPVPTFAEQLAFEQVFHACDTAIEQTEQMIGKLEAVKQGLLQDLLTRGIDANGELRPLQSEAPHLPVLTT